jgi:lipid A disaccharide synthetase
MDHASYYQERKTQMMTTEVFNGNEEPTLEEQRMAAAKEPSIEVMEISRKTETQKQTQAFLEIAEALHAKEQEIAILKQRVKDLEDLLSSK